MFLIIRLFCKYVCETSESVNLNSTPISPTPVPIPSPSPSSSSYFSAEYYLGTEQANSMYNLFDSINPFQGITGVTDAIPTITNSITSSIQKQILSTVVERLGGFISDDYQNCLIAIFWKIFPWTALSFIPSYFR